MIEDPKQFLFVWVISINIFFLFFFFVKADSLLKAEEEVAAPEREGVPETGKPLY